jgi:hypothetical protein
MVPTPPSLHNPTSFPTKWPKEIPISFLVYKFTSLAQLHLCSVCGRTKEKLDERNQNMLVWLSKMVLAQHFSF